MLKKAIGYENKLKLEMIWARDMEENKYFFDGGYSLQLDNDYNKSLEYISVDNDNNLIGFIKCTIYNEIGCDFRVINFSKENENIFSTDIIECIKIAFEVYSLKEIRFTVHNEHPLLEKYARIITRLGGEKFKANENGYFFYKISRENYIKLVLDKTYD